MIDQRISSANRTFDVNNHLFGRGTFTRSNGKVVSRIYERLTKASRRRDPKPGYKLGNAQAAYRQGVYDAFKALQDEL